MAGNRTEDILLPSTPVARHGMLVAKGSRIVDQQGLAVQLQGVTLGRTGSSSSRRYYAPEVVSWLAQDWNISLIRACMEIDYEGGYLAHKTASRAMIKNVVDAAIVAGIYVIISWHDHRAEQHIDEATEFFETMAEKYSDVPHVIFEPYTEPGIQSWQNILKPYHEALVESIRKYSNNLIILGTPRWSQALDVASWDQVAGTNLAYTLHVNAAKPASGIQRGASMALSSMMPIFVTEWTTGMNWDGAQQWLRYFQENNISHVSWGIDSGDEEHGALQPDADPAGGWVLGDLSRNGG
eukprot:CAMPEP_0168367892 /NCGR_PEP_ID=MMETSP0228-20121227/5969_1 /TAXON_ID=133427 /ORGANISM="Protoceratium reticulatum, Strain CCCM 535 (=CCMP 1889)" /LENGTH=295 /DNA_ID=CAMNT_0008380721 /DNA_START=68 /DNA_END=951 /DNA_ORIENTATION=+